MIGRMLLYKFEQPMFDKLKAKLEADADDENENAENIGNGITLHFCDFGSINFGTNNKKLTLV